MQLREVFVTPLPAAIVFDLDGTIIDTESAEFLAVQRVWTDHGIDFPESRWAHVIGLPANEPWIATLEAEFGQPLDHEEIYQRQRRYNAEYLAGVDARPGIRELITAATAVGVPLAVASNAPTWWIERRLDALDLRSCFLHLIGVDIAAAAKPDPAPFRQACQGLGVNPAQSVAIEDSSVGVRSAVAAGLFTVACPGPLTLTHDLSSAHWIVDSHHEITLETLADLILAVRPDLTSVQEPGSAVAR